MTKVLILDCLYCSLNPYIAISILGVAYSLLASALWPIAALIIPEYQLGTAYGIMQVSVQFYQGCRAGALLLGGARAAIEKNPFRLLGTRACLFSDKSRSEPGQKRPSSTAEFYS